MAGKQACLQAFWDAFGSLSLRPTLKKYASKQASLPASGIFPIPFPVNMTETRLTWNKAVPEPAELHVAECGMYVFEISKALEPAMGYLLQMWQTRPEDWPLLVWEMDGYSLDEAKARAERLADQHVPFILAGQS